MHIEDFFVKPLQGSYQDWQAGTIQDGSFSDAEVVLFSLLENDAETLRPLWDYCMPQDLPPCCYLGNFIPGKTQEDSHTILEELLHGILQEKKLPVCLGGNRTMLNLMTDAVSHYTEKVTPVLLDSMLSFGNPENSLTENNFWSKLFLNEKIKNPVCIGLQEYNSDPKHLQLFQDLGGEAVRIAEVVSYLPEAEALMRDAEVAALSCRALAYGYQNRWQEINPNGFQPREACKILKDAGLSTAAKAFGIFDIESYAFVLNAQYISQLVWHLLDGISIRFSHPSTSEKEEYFILAEDEKLTFHREVFHDRWWVLSEEKKEPVPCTRKDFEAAKMGIYTDRILKFL